MKKSLATKILLIATALLVTIVILMPIILVFPSMFKDEFEIWRYPWTFFPKNWTNIGFRWVFNIQLTTLGVSFIQCLFTTILISVVAVVLSLSINILAAFAFARLRFPFKTGFFIIMITTMFIPGITILLTSIRVVYILGIFNTVFCLIIPGLASAYNVFFFRQFFLGFPKDIDDSAKLDGCSSFRTLWHIYLPMSKTPAIIIGASVFIGYYNSYIWPSLTILADNKGLYQLMQVIRKLFEMSSQIGYGSVLAGTSLALIPPLLVFILIQRQIKDGIALTGTKG